MSTPPSINSAAPGLDFTPSPAKNACPPEAADHIDRRIEMLPTTLLIVNSANARTHSKRQIEQIAHSIQRFGFLGAVLIDEANQIIAGHGRVEAAKQLGLDQVPVLRVSHLSAAERKAYAIADNRLAELAGWDGEILAIELAELREFDFDLAAIGFELEDVEIVCNGADKAHSPDGPKTEPGACTCGRPVSGAGDVWLLGPHQLRCAEADDDASYAAIDVAMERWQRAAGEPAKLAGKTFAEIKKERANTALCRTASNQGAA